MARVLLHWNGMRHEDVRIGGRYTVRLLGIDVLVHVLEWTYLPRLDRKTVKRPWKNALIVRRIDTGKLVPRPVSPRSLSAK